MGEDSPPQEKSVEEPRRDGAHVVSLNRPLVGVSTMITQNTNPREEERPLGFR